MSDSFDPNIPLVYVAGPYVGKVAHDESGYHAIDRHIGVARKAAAWLVSNDFYVFTPHLNSAHFEVITPQVTPAHWYALDLRILSHCDALFVVEGWEDSTGTKKEIEYCVANRIPIFFDTEKGRAALLAFKEERSKR